MGKIRFSGSTSRFRHVYVWDIWFYFQVQYLDTLVVRFDQGLRFPSTEYVQAQILQEMNSGEI